MTELALVVLAVAVVVLLLVLGWTWRGMAALRAQLAVAEERAAGLPALQDELRARISLAPEQARLGEALAQAERSLQNVQQQSYKDQAMIERLREENRTQESELARLGETLAQERRAAAEKLQLLTQAREDMKLEFQSLAQAMVTQHGEAVTKQNKEQIDAVLTPLREKLTEFQQGLANAHTETAKDRAALGEQIRNLSQASATMTQETANLTRALKGKSQTQGAWGEMILSSILEKSGLRAGEEYSVQESATGEDGQRLRPDVIVNLPGGQHLVIDSKVSLTAFEAHVNAESEADRATSLAGHVASLRNHIKTLAGKDYQGQARSGVDYVVMFVPIEGALAVALQSDPELTVYAVGLNVAIATPTTLMVALRTAATVWRVERQNRNADKIAERAGRIYDKFVGFAQDLGNVRKAIGQAGDACDEALAKLSTGRGNLVNQAETLRRLGAKTSRSLPGALLEASGIDEETAADEAV